MDTSRRPYLLALILFTTTLAAYIIDDRDTIIDYSPLNQWDASIDPQEYGRTETVADCFTANNCHMRMPFVGSGITLYVAVGHSIDYQISIDGSVPAPFHIDGIPFGFTYNNTAYDNQNLSFGHHVLDLGILNSTGLHANPSGSSVLYIDRAEINEGNQSPTTTSVTTITAALSATPSHQQGRKHVVMPVVGGLVAAAILLITALSIFLCLRKRKEYHRQVLDKSKPIVTDQPESVPKASLSLSPTQPTSYASSLPSEIAFPTPYVQAPTLAYSRLVVQNPSTNYPMTPELADLTRHLPDKLKHAKHSATNKEPPGSLSTALVTPPEALGSKLILRLCNLNVPPEDITRVISILNRRDESTIEDAEFLQRLYNFEVPAEEINLIIGCMQKKNPPPRYGFKD